PSAPPPPPAARGDSRGAREEKNQDQLAAAEGNLTVTGSRIPRPNLSTRAAATVAEAEPDSGEGSLIVTGARTRAAGRGDWNACTVEDPSRSLSGCRHLVDPKARGTAGQASARLAEGLSSAWQGDYREAIGAFDRAVAAAPQSAFAYLNRGLARKRDGDLDGALADLDRAVRYAPRTARLYYQRAQILRQRGDEKRARADERRAANLDPDYEALVR
ncbi:MAG TPA: tetratricopeptide repeat protein, partial [Allosphingosinicella sp.]